MPPSFESLLENNPLRSRVREAMEVKCLREGTDVGTVAHGLHIACGNGAPTALIRKHFDVTRMSAVDRDPAMIASARQRHAEDGTVDFSVQDARSLSFTAELFDAVFDLADLHNYPDWKGCLLELRRVLKPGGLLILEELSRESFAHAAGRVFKAFTEHPYESMLTVCGFQEHVRSSGFQVRYFREKNPLGLLRYFVMVAQKV